MSDSSEGDNLRDKEETVIAAVIEYRKVRINRSTGTWSDLMKRELDQEVNRRYLILADAVDALVEARDNWRFEQVRY